MRPGAGRSVSEHLRGERLRRARALTAGAVCGRDRVLGIGAYGPRMGPFPAEYSAAERSGQDRAPPAVLPCPCAHMPSAGPMPSDRIVVRGAREHNRKNIDVEMPRDRLIVITGLSGSGKSSLAFDTIYAEGQGRYVESLSAYARQFLGPMGKPDVDHIEGLSPAISIDQRGASRNPRSTVATP